MDESMSLESKNFFQIHPSHQESFGRVIRILMLFAFIVILFWVAPLFFNIPNMDNDGYLPLHILLETVSIVIAMQVSGIGWNSYQHKFSANIVFLSSVFFGVAILDFTHLLSYVGMPAFFTPSGPDKAIYFWLNARFLSSVGLLIFAYFSFSALKSKTLRYIFFFSMLVLVTLLHWPLFFHDDWLINIFFIPGQGLTPLKIYSEYSLIIINLVTAILLYKQMKKAHAYQIAALFGAVCMMAMSEFLFTLYSDLTDMYNILGHIYKAIAYVFIYRAIFVTAIERPYQELHESQKQLHDKNQLLDSIIENIPHMIFLKHASDLRYALFNRAGEKLTGFSREKLLGHNDYEFFPKEQADFFIQKDKEILGNGGILDIAEEKIDTPTGTRILHTKKLTLKDADGKPSYLLGISEDITQRKQIEDSLHESQVIAGLGSYVLDIKTGIWTSSDVLDSLLGINKNYNHSYKGWEKLIHPDDWARMDHYFKSEVITQKKPFNQEYRIIRQNDSSERWVHGLGKLEFDADGKLLRMIGTIQDITERKLSSNSLQKLSLAVEQSPNSIVITDINGNIEYVNKMFTTVTGYSFDEAIGQNPKILKSDETLPSIYNEMWTHLTSGKIWNGELINRKKDGTTYIESATISPVKQKDGTITNYVAIKEDITQKKKAEARIENLAHFDQLTGLPNRIMLNDRITYLLNMAQRNNEPLSVMFLDLDHFKNINDTLGHTAGDQLLIAVAKRIKMAIRDEDTVSRLGGDEFILLFPDTDANTAMHIATKLIEAVSKPSIIENHELTITPSIGIAVYPNDGADFETLLKNADTAMYQVKNDSRNSFNFFTQEMQQHLARNLQLVNAMRQALKRKELELYYQPQISIEDGHIIGAEALLRWNHPELGMISPAEFIPIAEDSGQIIEIGEWVLRSAAFQMKQWLDEGFGPMIIAVNISAVQFRQTNLTQLITNILNETKLPSQYLELELTEAVTMSDPKVAIDVMNTLHGQGIRMSIDDFGTGYSSLSYLKQFKVYKLKIDQSFIRNITDDSEDRAIVSAIIDMANNLGLRTIAEGVETSEQLSFLRLHGCNEVQGYYFSKPLRAKEFLKFIKRNASTVL
ncbi:EAL domain-containing protein [bacterium]|nr:EAL domain-containing protein [bacterium]MBU1434863.1 EAL domain-containing protein [bacterium]MBU1503968.1 EAL domain-containing protein [bacterium]